MLAAVILAGRENKGRLAGVSDAAWEALVDVAGRPMVAYVVDALRGLGDLERIVMVGPPLDLPEATGREGAPLAAVAPEDSLVANLRRGVEAAGPCTELLVATCDIPLVTTDEIREFVTRCREREADLGYPIVPRESCEAAFPGVRRTYVRLADGSFTGGNVIYMRGDALERVWPFLEHVYALRKKPLRLLPLFGFGIALAVLLGRARVDRLERRVGELARLRACAIPMERPAIAVDVDKPEDLELASRALASRSVRP